MNMSGVYRTPPVVKNLLIINALIFMAQELLPFGKTMTGYGALHYWESPWFGVWQHVSYMFLHNDIGHLFFNMFALWMFGRVLEYDLGSKRFLVFYLLSGIGAGILYNCVNWIQFHYFGIPPGATIGASGAIYGILLGFGMLHPNSIILLFFMIPMKAKYLVILFMVLELFWGFQGGDGVAHFAHITGMISAFILLKYWLARGGIHKGY